MDVYALRLRLGLNGKQFARLVGCSVSTLSRWEHGHAEPDGALLAIVEAFGAASAVEHGADYLRACAKDGLLLRDVLQDLFSGQVVRVGAPARRPIVLDPA